MKSCFIITPIGDGGSEIRRHVDGIISSVIRPVLKEFNYEDIKAAHEINESGMITEQIIDRIISDDLVIVNLTGNNPNVMYELCLRHVVARPVINMCQNQTRLPFDISDNRTIFYANDMLGVKEASDELRKTIIAVESQTSFRSNPIYINRQNNISIQSNHYLIELIITAENIDNGKEVFIKRLREKQYFCKEIFYSYDSNKMLIRIAEISNEKKAKELIEAEASDAGIEIDFLK